MGFEDELWDGFDTVLKQSVDGKVFVDKLAAWYQKRAALEREYAKKLRKLSEVKEADMGSLQRCWEAVTAQTQRTAQLHLENAEKVSQSCEAQLAEFVKATAAQRSSLMSNGKTLLKELKVAGHKKQTASESLSQAKKKLDDNEAELERATFNNNVKQADKLGKHKQSLQKSLEKAQGSFQDASQRYVDTHVRVWDVEMPKVLQLFEIMERSRIKAVQNVFRGFGSLLVAFSFDAVGGVIVQAADSVQDDADIQEFIQTKRTGAVKPGVDDANRLYSNPASSFTPAPGPAASPSADAAGSKPKSRSTSLFRRKKSVQKGTSGSGPTSHDSA
eukprot:CAMPEP_0119136444 /NCGR_PEP_ID=MMETSP1310-20130426/21438_1 /TAXON_ID=464262 /ORGANISM="Genus nov. species nov., Strain RCC2339" /LENGTH=330 /DNA_ID=CAMNT_0007127431 /DNA_START=125 /DNA_END=1113 /DNA_ORIENTATION=+